MNNPTQKVYDKMLQTVASFDPLFDGNLLSFRKKNVLYHGFVLDDRSREYMLNNFTSPERGWSYICHHITFGTNYAKHDSYFAKNLLGRRGKYKVTTFGYTEGKICAFGVEVEGTANKYPHITFALNAQSAKPFESNLITEWRPLENPFWVFGFHTEIIKKL